MNLRTAVCVFAMTCVVPMTGSAKGKSAAGSASGGLSAEKFVQEAATAGLAEVEVSQLALERSKNAQVKSFAQMMVDDHSKANKELSSVAASKNLQVPTAVTPQQEAALDKLRTKSGTAFDRAFVTQMERDHKNAVDLFQKAAAAKSLDTNLRDFAKTTLPTLRHHRQEADRLNSEVGSMKQSHR